MITIPIPPSGPKVTSMIWGSLDEKLITGHENGDIVQWNVKEHHKDHIVHEHTKSISDMQLSPDGKKFAVAFKIHAWNANLTFLLIFRNDVHFCI